MKLSNLKDNIFYVMILTFTAFILFLTQFLKILENGIEIGSFRLLGFFISILFLSIVASSFYIFRYESSGIREVAPLIAPVFILTIIFIFSAYWFGFSEGPKNLSNELNEMKKIEQASSISEGSSILKDKAEENYYKFEVLKRLEDDKLISDYDYRVKKSDLLKKF